MCSKGIYVALTSLVTPEDIIYFTVERGAMILNRQDHLSCTGFSCLFVSWKDEELCPLSTETCAWSLSEMPQAQSPLLQKLHLAGAVCGTALLGGSERNFSLWGRSH